MPGGEFYYLGWPVEILRGLTTVQGNFQPVGKSSNIFLLIRADKSCQNSTGSFPS